MFKRKRSDEDFAAEIRSHLELESDALKEEGVSGDEAKRRSRVEFGSVPRVEEQFRVRGRALWLENLWRDGRFGLRQMLRNPGFATTAIVVLALGIGASVAIFAFVDAALLEPMPYANPNRLMAVNQSRAEPGLWPLSYPDFRDWQRLNKSLQSLDVVSGAGYLLHAPGGAEPVAAARVSGGFFRTLGVRPALGRDFNAGEDRLGGPNVTLMSYGAWLHRFSGRSNVVGEAVTLDSTTYTIIGVLPSTFSFAMTGNTEFWVPINELSPHEHSRNFYNFFGVGRLRDGVSPQAAQAEMASIAKDLNRQYPAPGFDLTAMVAPLTEVFIGQVRPILLTLLGGACLLLLIACVNAASLVLVRSESRRREAAVRAALGATWGRLVRQFVVEGMALALAGGVAGVAIAAALMQLLRGLVPKDMAARMPFVEGVHANAHTMAFAGTIVVGAAALLAGTTTLRLAFQKMREGLAVGDRGATSVLWQRLGANLVVVELAIAVVLLTGAGLLGKSLYRLLHVPLGFEPAHLATLRVMAPGSSYPIQAQVAQLMRNIASATKSLAGVEQVGMTSLVPAQCDCAEDRIHFPSRPDHGEHNEVDERHVSPGYLRTLKASLIRGRFFTEDDDGSMPNVAVINETLARKYFGSQDPLGQKIADEEGGRPTEWQIVGVIEDVREGPLDAPVAPTEYFPLAQTADNSFTLVVRTGQDAAALLPTLATLLHQVDGNLGVSDESTMDAKIEGTQAALLHRFAAFLIGGFAAMALVLGVVGLYGVISHSVSQRTREIGVRMALGAQRAAVYGLVMRRAGILIAAGLMLGVAGAVGVATLIRKILFGVTSWDAATLAGVVAVLGSAALAASFLPARRAAQVDPVEALRAE
jgi:macrolide transport system ATP-binding/permease protein